MKNRIILSSTLLFIFQLSPCLADGENHKINYFDLNGNNAVSFDEFYIVMIREKGAAIFNTFSQGDYDQNGVISISESMDFNVTKQEYQHVDKDRNEQVSFQEFSSVMLQDMFNQFDLNHDHFLTEPEFNAVLD